MGLSVTGVINTHDHQELGLGSLTERIYTHWPPLTNPFLSTFVTNEAQQNPSCSNTHFIYHFSKKEVEFLQRTTIEP